MFMCYCDLCALGIESQGKPVNWNEVKIEYRIYIVCGLCMAKLEDFIKSKPYQIKTEEK